MPAGSADSQVAPGHAAAQALLHPANPGCLPLQQGTASSALPGGQCVDHTEQVG